MPSKPSALPTTPLHNVGEPNTSPLLLVARLGVNGGNGESADGNGGGGPTVSNGYQATIVVSGGGTHAALCAVEMAISSTYWLCWVCQKTPENVVTWAFVWSMSGVTVNHAPTGGSTHSRIRSLPPATAKSISATRRVGTLAITGFVEKKTPAAFCRPQFAALGSSSGSSPMMNVPPLELPSVAWVACAPLTFD